MNITQTLNQTTDNYNYWEYEIPSRILYYDDYNIKVTVSKSDNQILDYVVNEEPSGLWFHNYGKPILHIFDKVIILEKFYYFCDTIFPEDIGYLGEDKFKNRIKKFIKYVKKAKANANNEIDVNVNVKEVIINDLQKIIERIGE